MATTSKLKTVHLPLPAAIEQLAALEIGTVVYLTGRVYTAREGVYKRAVEDGAGLPAAPEQLGFANFHCSPAARRRKPALRGSFRPATRAAGAWGSS